MASGRFYERMFGATIEASKGANGLPRCNLTLGGQLILISTVDGSVTRTASGPHSGLGLDHIGLRVDNMAAAVAELKAKGAEFLMEPKGQNTRIAFIKGPDAVSIELVGP